MQQPISNKIQLGDTLNPAKDYGGAPSADDEGNLENLIGKVGKVGGFWKTGKADGAKLCNGKTHNAQKGDIN